MRRFGESTISPLIYHISNLSKTYEANQVLEIKELEIFRGEIFTLVGPSGAGKSTFLRLLNFLEFPDTGKIEFNGASFKRGQEMPLHHRRRVTMVFQRPILLDRSVWDNVTYGLRLRGNKNARDEVSASLEEVGLTRLAKKRARTLSGGEAQRVALARAMVLEPDVLLLDEPTANLDPYNVSLIEDIVREINEQHQTTIVLVTHNVFQAKRLAERVALILNGKIIEVAEVSKFFSDPEDERTTAFINGDMVY
ncbi:MAG: phosphate ABC transporter ATP-binding protein [Anaerolineales bacterium]|nr:phosphate ABC transporter ATP-binding protein [Anaerolineales bacterium]